MMNKRVTNIKKLVTLYNQNEMIIMSLGDYLQKSASYKFEVNEFILSSVYKKHHTVMWSTFY